MANSQRLHVSRALTEVNVENLNGPPRRLSCRAPPTRLKLVATCRVSLTPFLLLLGAPRAATMPVLAYLPFWRSDPFGFSPSPVCLLFSFCRPIQIRFVVCTYRVNLNLLLKNFHLPRAASNGPPTLSHELAVTTLSLTQKKRLQGTGTVCACFKTQTDHQRIWPECALRRERPAA